MRRRELIGAIAGGVLWPMIARAHQAGRLPVVGILWHAASQAEEGENYVWLHQGLDQAGLIPGRNISLEERYAADIPEHFADIAAEFARLRVDLILTNTTLATRAAQKATSTIPIVFLAADPVRMGIVPSFSHPGGNATGFSLMIWELDSKRLQIFKDAIPGLSRVGLLINPDFRFGAERDLEEYGIAAAKYDVTLEKFEARNEEEVRLAISKASQSRLDGLIICQWSGFDNLRQGIAKSRLTQNYPPWARGGFGRTRGRS